jgi:hypothetical protein
MCFSGISEGIAYAVLSTGGLPQRHHLCYNRDTLPTDWFSPLLGDGGPLSVALAGVGKAAGQSPISSDDETLRKRGLAAYCSYYTPSEPAGSGGVLILAEETRARRMEDSHLGHVRREHQAY